MKTSARHAKVQGILLFFLFYAVAYVAGYFASLWISSILFRLFFFDLVATLIIWIFSLLIKNSSVYDPYWSLTPWVMLCFLVVGYWPLDWLRWVFFAAFSIWSFRLTSNWIFTFGGLHWEDWRYRKYREENPAWRWHLINFFGIQIFPTLLVFSAFLPAILLMEGSANELSLFGDFVILLGTGLEILADRDVHAFLKENSAMERKPVCQRGLWNFSRHPNYLGEVTVWFGVFMAYLPTHAEKWYLGFGAILVLSLFLFISIPLMEKRQCERRPDYADYQKTTSVLLLLPKKKAKKS